MDKNNIRQLLADNENEAREIKAWIDNNKHADVSLVQAKKQKLLQCLHNINDLVCELRPFKLYTLR